METTTTLQPIRYRCSCGKKLKASPTIVDKKVKCTRCEHIHRVPKQARLTSRKEPAATADQLAARSVISASIAKPPVVIAGPASEPSLLPKNSDGSDSRFKLAPPADQQIDLGPHEEHHNFEFDIRSIQIDTGSPKSHGVTTKTSKADAKNAPGIAPGMRHTNGPGLSANRQKIAISATAALVGVLLLSIAGYWAITASKTSSPTLDANAQINADVLR